ncbi:MDR/zinc-dependent alcohol dehydrogenase-like family protein [Bryobacter aggregatus]|uniref:MDR/zinc-dependent alcohol dehydrogenase-like family protein n=1 Tax=Bryobacter aggregatus TaxID=360054 RepID=UPI0004E0DABD|nr:alcohol dehydrogenase catalytic domain-containing protein [Bryobacter aggregatus]
MIAVHIASGKLSVIDTPKPKVKAGHALLRLRLAGICNTDLELLRGYYGFSGIPGHEFVADVMTGRLKGKRVVGEINLACGRCDFCQSGMGRHCAKRSVLGIVRHPGAFAEYLTLPEENLLTVPAALADEEAVFTEPLAAACEILEQVRFAKGAEVAVLGDGKLGLLIAQVLQLAGLRVDLFGRNQPKMDLLRPLGVNGKLVSRIHPRLPQSLYQYVIDATGSTAGLEAAMQMVRPRGTIVMKSTVAGKLTLDTAPLIVNEISLVGSRCGRFSKALKLLKTGDLILQGMITERKKLSEAVAGFQAAEQPGALKVLLEP